MVGRETTAENCKPKVVTEGASGRAPLFLSPLKQDEATKRKKALPKFVGKTFRFRLVDFVRAAGEGVIEDVDTADIHGVAATRHGDGVVSFG